jgi:hypothetical protein
MIIIGDYEYGQAAEIAVRLGPAITHVAVRRRADRGLITVITYPGQGRGTTWYRYDQAGLGRTPHSDQVMYLQRSSGQRTDTASAPSASGRPKQPPH